MIVKILNYLLSLFGSNYKAKLRVERDIETQEKKLKEIENEKTDIDSVVDRFNQ